jgi:hypothetical protein
MSSNMYGFTCEFWWNGRLCHAQIVYVGTGYDDEETLIRATRGWETEDPVALAKYELEHRDWSKPGYGEARLQTASIVAGWLETDPQHDPTWRPPTPNPREVLQIIADGAAMDIEHGWDT